VKRAVLYLRSSKDRNDVSIDAQRRELQQLAASRNLAIVGEHADVVLSGKDENRPGFQALVRELAARNRPWSAILALDTSRIARRQDIAHNLRQECKQRGVDLIFAKTPELAGLAGIYLPAVLHATDEGHSYMSREKGLAGMAETVRRGFRAGGRAPFGYDLEHIDTGARRDGQAVMKSRLVPNADAKAIAAYLKGRAAGRNGRELLERHGLAAVPRSSLVCMEWNALTYAGHTVWNVHAERIEKGYAGGHKRRPRADWIIQPDTHEALISQADADAILQRLEAGRARYATRGTYLLGGILEEPGGHAWHGNRIGERLFYRATSSRKNVKAEAVERAVLAQLAEDLRAPAFAEALTARLKREWEAEDAAAELPATQRRLGELDRRIARLTNLLQETTAHRPILAQLEQLEAERTAAADKVAALTRQAELGRVARQVRASDVAAFLATLAERLGALEREDLKAGLLGLIKRVELDPVTFRGRVRYGFRVTPESGVLVASPRGHAQNPTLYADSPPFPIEHRRRAA
jgi:site-specific DNA recombinase